MPTDLTDAHPASAVNTCGAFSHLWPQAKRRMLSLTRVRPFLVYSCSPLPCLPCCGRCAATRARQSLLPCAHAWHAACTIQLCLRSGLAFYRIGKRPPQRHNHSSALINLISRIVDAAACLTVPAFMPDAQAQPRVAHCHTEAAPLFQAAAFRTCTLTPRPCSWLCL